MAVDELHYRLNFIHAMIPYRGIYQHIFRVYRARVNLNISQSVRPQLLGGVNTVTSVARLVRRWRDSSLKLGMTFSVCHVERSRDISVWVVQLCHAPQ